jgi:hypothetical protein
MKHPGALLVAEFAYFSDFERVKMQCNQRSSTVSAGPLPNVCIDFGLPFYLENTVSALTGNSAFFLFFWEAKITGTKPRVLLRTHFQCSMVNQVRVESALRRTLKTFRLAVFAACFVHLRAFK